MSDTATQPTNPEPAAPPSPAKLTEANFQRIVAAYGRLGEVTNRLSSPLVTPNTEALKAERVGLEKFISGALLAHATEFLGCYNIVHQEYQPILKSLVIIARRIGIAPVPDEIPQPDPNGCKNAEPNQTNPNPS